MVIFNSFIYRLDSCEFLNSQMIRDVIYKKGILLVCNYYMLGKKNISSKSTSFLPLYYFCSLFHLHSVKCLKAHEKKEDTHLQMFLSF